MPKKGKCFLNVRLKDTLFNEKFNRRIYINNKIVMRSFVSSLLKRHNHIVLLLHLYHDIFSLAYAKIRHYSSVQLSSCPYMPNQRILLAPHLGCSYLLTGAIKKILKSFFSNPLSYLTYLSVCL